MKVYYTLVLAILAVACSSNRAELGTTPLVLDDLSLTIDIPTFLGNEAIFRSQHDDISMRAEEEYIEYEIEGKDEETLHYVRYSQWSSSSDLVVANFKDFKFRYITLCTDLEDENTFLIGVEKSELAPEEITPLVANLKSKLGEPLAFDKIDRPVSDNVFYQWNKDDKVIKLVLNTTTYDLNDDEKVNNWQESLYAKDENIKATLFIATKKFDKCLEDTHGFSGMLTSYY